MALTHSSIAPINNGLRAFIAFSALLGLLCCLPRYVPAENDLDLSLDDLEDDVETDDLFGEETAALEVRMKKLKADRERDMRERERVAALARSRRPPPTPEELNETEARTRILEEERQDIQKELGLLAKQPEFPEQWLAGVLDTNVLVFPGDRDPAGVVIRRTGALLRHIQATPGAPDLTALGQALGALRDRHAKITPGAEEAKALYAEACELRRRVMLSNPILDFDRVAYTAHDNRYRILQTQNYACTAPAGGGIYIASGIRSTNVTVTNIIIGAIVKNGRLQGQPLKGGAFNSLALSYDGKKLLFSWADQPGVGKNKPYGWTPQTTFNIFRINTDGSDLVQLTDSKYNDYHAAWLPGGRIVFVSDRRNVTVRCQNGGELQPCGTLYSMKGDGSDIICISYHETTELQPTVDDHGMISYTRWDYVDRDFSAAHHIWTCYPDGRNPRAPHGNYAQPHTTLEGDVWHDKRTRRPWGEYGIRPIPGSSGRYMAVAGGHHVRPEGVIVLIDINQEDDDGPAQVKSLTKGRWPHESVSPNRPGGRTNGHRVGSGVPTEFGLGQTHFYFDPRPLNESFCLAAQSHSGRVFLIDKFGNRELLFVSRTGLQVRYPIPIKPRHRSGAYPIATFQGERNGQPGHSRAVISIMDVYQSDFEWPPGVSVKAIRVIQVIPKPWSMPTRNNPRLGYAMGASARMVLGTAPVEEDGSAYFEAPVGREIFFQAIDEKGMAIQSMRSGTYLHPGEHLTCVGCHEHKWRAPQVKSVPLAVRRAPSKLQPEVDGTLPFNYYRLAKPALDRSCMPCHQKQGKGPAKSDYRALQPYAFYFHGNEWAHGLTPLHGGYRTIAGKFGARHSRMGKAMLNEQHQKHMAEGSILKEDFRRISLWLDMNSAELGAYHGVAEQRQGRIQWPCIDVDTNNPTGVEFDRPLPFVPADRSLTHATASLDNPTR